MEKVIAVTIDDREVGRVELTPVGLYYSLFCFCDRKIPEQMHLIAICGDRDFDLGSLRPDRQGAILKRLIPAKQIGDKPSFVLRQSHSNFISLKEGIPFAYLDRLMDGCFIRENGQAGILFQSRP